MTKRSLRKTIFETINDQELPSRWLNDAIFRFLSHLNSRFWFKDYQMGYTLTGSNDRTLIVEGDSIRIIVNPTFFGSRREKSIPISSVTSVEVKEPGFIIVGFIQFSIAGARARDSSYTLTGGAFDAVKDENSVVFKGDENYRRALAIKDYVERRIHERSSPSAPAGFSAADEILKLKKLLDEGILTKEEFDAKKRQLLNLSSSVVPTAAESSEGYKRGSQIEPFRRPETPNEWRELGTAVRKMIVPGKLFRDRVRAAADSRFTKAASWIQTNGGLQRKLAALLGTTSILCGLLLAIFYATQSDRQPKKAVGQGPKVIARQNPRITLPAAKTIGDGTTTSQPKAPELKLEPQPPTPQQPSGAELRRHGLEQLEAGHFSQAIESFSRAIELSPTAENYGDRAIAYFKNGDIEMAKIDSEIAEGLIEKSKPKVDPNVSKASIESLTRTIRKKPTAEAYAKRAIAHFQSGNFDQAALDRETAERLSKEAASRAAKQK